MRIPIRCSIGVGFLLTVATCVAACSAGAAWPASAATATSPAGDLDEDRPAPFVPLHPRSEADSDRIEAAADFATGRTLEQRGAAARALRQFERAIRLDPRGTPILRELVPLAYAMNRRSEALRYAVKLAELDDSDPGLARRIGLYLAEEGDWHRAAQLLARSLNTEQAASPPTAVVTQLRVELARIDFLLARYAQAAALFDKVLPALRKPKDYGLTPDAARKLIGDDGLTYELIAATFLEVNRPADAAQAFQRLNDLAPHPGLLALDLARVDEKSKHPADALAKLDEYFDSHPAELSLASLELLKTVLGDFNQSGQLVPRLEKLHRRGPIRWCSISFWRSNIGNPADSL